MSESSGSAGRGLSIRILLLVLAFLVLGEVLVYLPSIARFRLVWYDDLLQRAHIATIGLRGRHDGAVDPALEDALLSAVGAIRIRLEREDGAIVLGAPARVDAEVELERVDWIRAILDALETLRHGGARLIRVAGPARMEAGARVVAIVPEATLWYEMVDYSRRILLLTLFLATLMAVLLLFALHRLVVRPLQRLGDQVARFRAAPEEAVADPPPHGRRDEIGALERQFAAMRRDIRELLFQRGRLAAVGAAVARLHHDIRNVLASAMLVSDGLEASDDPRVRERAQRILGALERAARLCESTLDYARARPPRLEPTPVRLAELVGELATLVRDDLRFVVEVPPELVVRADRERLWRALLNLVHNAEAVLPPGGTVRITARTRDGRVEIEVADDGPGIPEAIRDRLFEPFAAGRPGGSGLGLAICREILRAHGGEVELVETGPGGTRFRLILPDHGALGESAP